MTIITIGTDYDGIRLDKYLKKHFPSADSGFLYKMLRKKNIVLNGKKATGSETLAANDEIKVFFSDDTYEKLRSADAGISDYDRLLAIKEEPSVLHEEKDFLLLDKPAGLLSQKAKKDDISLNEIALSYLIRKDGLTEKELSAFRPSVMNRLDRNTSGIVAFAKTYEGARFLSEGLKAHSIRKEYQALVLGECKLSGKLHAYLKKEEKTNRSFIAESAGNGAKEVAMRIGKSVPYTGVTLLTIELLTGRSHQIRAWLAALGYPIVGDAKYGGKDVRAKRQLLHARRLIMPDGREYTAELPADFQLVLDALEKQ